MTRTERWRREREGSQWQSFNSQCLQVVLTDDAKRFADQMGIRLFETSAKDNINVEEMFRAITELVLKSKKVSPKLSEESFEVKNI